MLIPFMQGFGVGGGLIVAIGAQNAFVLTQGVRRQHHFIIPTLCAFGDIILITIGVLGTGQAVAANPALGKIMAWGGAAFLAWYGWGNFMSAFKGGRLEENEDVEGSLKRAIMTTLAVTFLNPHAYLDTVVMVGGISGQFADTSRYIFGLGACTASVTWFYSLSLGGKLLSPVFANPMAWRILDGFICATMWFISFSLVRHALSLP